DGGNRERPGSALLSASGLVLPPATLTTYPRARATYGAHATREASEPSRRRLGGRLDDQSTAPCPRGELLGRARRRRGPRALHDPRGNGRAARARAPT